MEFDRPIMIVCTGRSGSTVFYRMIARHKDVGWLSSYNQAAPSLLWVSLFSNLYRLNIFDKYRHAKFFPKPFSPYKFWERYLPGITRHDRPLLPADVPPESIAPLRRDIQRILKYQGRKRFLLKVTGWARMAYFEQIFPGLRFIYIKRDPISVVSSWLNAGWLNVSGEYGTNEWEWGEVPEKYARIYHELGGGPVLSAAIKTQLDIDDIRRNIAMFPGRCYEIQYEEFVTDPVGYMRQVIDFCELDWDAQYEKIVRSYKIYNYADRWKKYISEENGRLLREFYLRANEESPIYVAE